MNAVHVNFWLIDLNCSHACLFKTLAQSDVKLESDGTQKRLLRQGFPDGGRAFRNRRSMRFDGASMENPHGLHADPFEIVTVATDANGQVLELGSEADDKKVCPTKSTMIKPGQTVIHKSRYGSRYMTSTFDTVRNHYPYNVNGSPAWLRTPASKEKLNWKQRNLLDQEFPDARRAFWARRFTMTCDGASMKRPRDVSFDDGMEKLKLEIWYLIDCFKFHLIRDDASGPEMFLAHFESLIRTLSLDRCEFHVFHAVALHSGWNEHRFHMTALDAILALAILDHERCKLCVIT